MRLHVLLLALFVLAARAATIPGKIEVDFEKKLSDAVKEVISKDEKVPENTFSEQELIDQANIVKDVENSLRKQVVDIPVNVVVADHPIVISNADKKEDNEVAPESEENIKREEIDVKNPPGPPQRQLHDTQNPEHFEDAKIKAAVATDNLNQAENQNQNALASVQENLNNWISNNQQIQNLQQSIRDFQESFTNQVGTITNIVKGVLQGNLNPLQPQGAPVPATVAPVATPNDASASAKPEDVQNDEKKTSGVRSVPVPKQENGTNSGTPSEGSQSEKPWWQQIQFTIGNMQSQLANLSQQFQQFSSQQQNTSSSGGFLQSIGSGLQIFNPQNLNNASQSDEPQKPGGIWQNIQNFFQGGQQPPQNAQSDTQQPPAQPNRPIIQAVQNAIGTFWRPGQNQGGQNEPQKPASPEKPDASQEGTNAVPEKPADQQKEPETATVAQSGPIKQLIANNPIAQGLAGAVQKIQHSIKPDQPRETIPEKDNHGVKGGLFIKPGHGGFKPGHGHKPDHGDNTEKVTAWSNFVNSLIGTIGATVNGSTSAISSAVNSGIDTVGSNLQGVLDSVTSALPDLGTLLPQLGDLLGSLPIG